MSFDLVLQKLIDSSPFISILITVFLGINNFYSFATAGNLERQFFSKEKKFFYEAINIIFLFILMPTVLIFSFHIIDNKIVKNFLVSNFYYFTILFLILYFTLLIINGIIKLKERTLLKKNILIPVNFIENKFINSIVNTRFRYGIITAFLLSSFIVFGVLNFTVLISSPNYYTTILIILVCGICEFILVRLVFMWALNVKFTKPILVSIEMENGRKYNEFYIYHPSNKKHILIGKQQIYEDCKEPILLNIEKIVSCAEIYKDLRFTSKKRSD